MQLPICVYLHGFLSSGNSLKGQWFAKQAMKEKLLSSKPLKEGGRNFVGFQKWLTPTYPLVSPQASLLEIEAVIRPFVNSPETPLLFVGSSMGGFYAQYLGQKYRIPYVMINPALNPIPLFEQHLGMHQSSVTGEAFCIDLAYIQQLKDLLFEPVNKKLDKRIPALLLIDDGDELIDIPFALAQYEQPNSEFQVQVYSGGDHAFQHLDEAWSVINTFSSTVYAPC